MTKQYEKILETEYSDEFDTKRKNAMVMSYYKYGPLKVNHGKDNLMDAIKNAKLRIEAYERTGNTELLVDAANFMMIEFMSPQHENAYYEATDTPQCELFGFGVNQLKDE